MTRKEAINAIRDNWPDSKFSMLTEALDMAIEALKTDVVRCGECKYQESTFIRNGLLFCNCSGMNVNKYVENQFCSYGERRTE